MKFLDCQKLLCYNQTFKEMDINDGLLIIF